MSEAASRARVCLTSPSPKLFHDVQLSYFDRFCTFLTSVADNAYDTCRL